MANIGNGRVLRVCDLCGQVDDHPRHSIAGTIPRNPITGESFPDRVVGGFPGPSDDIIAKVLASAPEGERARLIRDLMDTTTSDRHIDCCAAAGCPDDLCSRQVQGADGKTGKAMLGHLMGLGDVFADRPDVVLAQTEEVVGNATRGAVSKAVRGQISLMLGMLMLATRGLSTANLANPWLNVISGTTFTGAAGSFTQLHTGDPGASGTANVSSVTTRPSVTWSAASSGSKAMSGTVSWTNWAGTSPETVTDVADFSASSAGTFYFSVQLTASKTVQTGDTLTLSTLSVSLAPLAA